MTGRRIVIEREPTKPVNGRPRYVNLDQDVAEALDILAAKSGRKKFWLANHLLRTAIKSAKVEG